MENNNKIQKEFIKKNTISNEDKTKFLPKTNLVEEKKKEKKIENYEEEYYQLKWLVP